MHGETLKFRYILLVKLCSF